jgi:alanyl-tRNA synthetase
MGGQMGDIGTLIGDDGKSKKITNVQKFAGVILHFVE